MIALLIELILSLQDLPIHEILNKYFGHRTISTLHKRRQDLNKKMQWTIEEFVKEELKLKFHKKLEEDLFQVPLSSFDPTLQKHIFYRGDFEIEIESNDILIDDGEKEFKIIYGFSNSGSGKSILAKKLYQSWLKTDSCRFKNIDKHQICLLVDGNQLIGFEQFQLEFFFQFCPNSVTSWGETNLKTWFQKANLLFIIMNNHSSLTESNFATFLITLKEHFNSVTNIIFTNRSAAFKIDAEIQEKTKVFSSIYRIRPLAEEEYEPLACQILKSQMSNAVLNLDHLNALSPQLTDTVGVLAYYCDAFVNFKCSGVVVTDYIWESIIKRITTAVTFTGFQTGDTLDQVLVTMGHAVYDWMVENTFSEINLFRSIMERMELYYPVLTNTEEFLNIIFFKRSSSFYENNEDLSTDWSIRCDVILNVLVSWFVLQSCIKGSPIMILLKPLQNPDCIAVHIAGLLCHVIHQKQKNYIDRKKVNKIIKDICCHSENTKEPVSFVLCLLHEIKCDTYLTSLILQEVYLPPHLFVYDYALFDDAIDTVINHKTSVIKINIFIRRNLSQSMIQGTLKMLMTKDIQLNLAFSCHMEWKKRCKSNIFVQHFDKTRTTLKLTEFTGSLDSELIPKLTCWQITKNLICLRLRVCDLEETKTLFKYHSLLKSLLWLEIDFDLPIHLLISSTLPKLTTPLIDLSFTDIHDSQIKQLCEFLLSVSNHYSGIHLHRSLVSPQGVINMFKYFYCRGIKTSADMKSINKYRRHRFPELNLISTKGDDLSEDQVTRTIGYDDRHHYSDNEVRSLTYVADLKEINVLKYFLILLDDLIQFTYSCSNFSITKASSGVCSISKR